MIQELTERQIEIIRATISLISDDGVQNFSIRKLAARVGVTEPAVYRHFESKDDLMIKLASYIVRNWHEMFSELEFLKLPVVSQTARIFREVMGYLDENRPFAKTILSTDLFATDSGMTAILLDLKSEGLARFSELLAGGQTVGQVREDIDVLAVTSVFFSSVWWVVTDWIAGGYVEDLSAKWERIWNTLVPLIEKK